MPSVLLVGYDPDAIPGVDGTTIRAMIDQQMNEFARLGIEANLVHVVADGSAEPTLVAALGQRPWDVVLIGGGIRKSDNLVELLEMVVNLAHRHAAQAAIAFNTNPGDSVQAVQRQLR
ncbi:hypothetical protein DMH04_43545 [Kibdelosporangium aridum]|uniref:Uncharacterized protein n=1 Tax=Kibdelosporangium aridum TaxID=2030 RepID=A0A428YR89_KIBAR|nr:hypothetical protein [Kibdelosporangium aridum]RSM71602.1 hypothetical protein DMH04_43545 [Kibdelosporangium aridum]